MKLKSVEKEEEIYRVVLDITSQRGLTGLKMSAIAKQAGLAHGTVYIYFKNKKELINKLYQKAKRKATNSIIIDQPTDLGFMDELRLIWEGFLFYLIHNQQEIYFMQQCLNSSILEKDSHDLSDKFKDHMITFFTRGQQERYIKEMDIALILSVISGLGKEIVNQINQGHLTFDDQLLNDSFDLCWNAVRR